MRKTEYSGLPAGVSGATPLVLNCPEDFQTIIHISNATVGVHAFTFEGFPGPAVVNTFNVPALSTCIIVLGANEYSPAAAFGTVPPVVQYPAYADVRVTPDSWANFQFSVTHIAASEGFNVRKVEMQGLPAGISGTAQHIVDCSEDYQTIVHISNITGGALTFGVQAGPNPQMVNQALIPALTTVPFVFGAGAYTPGSAAAVVPPANQYGAYSTIRLAPVPAATWANFSLAVVHILA